MEFTSEFFAGNRKRLLETTGAQLVVLSAQGLLQRSADTTYPFRQDSNFWYLTGINEPDYIAVFTPEAAFLIAPERGDHRDAWDGAINNDELQSTSGIGDILDHHVGWNRLDRMLRTIKKVHTITPTQEYYDLFGFYMNPARKSLETALKKHRSLELVDVRKPVARLRQIKQEPELAAIQKAIDITSDTLTEIRKKLSKYKYEYEIAADFTGSIMKHGAKYNAFEPVIASGKHTTTIHHMNYDWPIGDAEIVLFDVGAEVSNYSADISRTYALKQPAKRTRDVYQAVIRVQKAAYKLLKPGVIHKEYEQKVDAIMALELQKLGLLKDLDDKKKLKKYYPHLTSHFLGLDTHDSADYEMPLEPGMVLTVEPGIYIPEEGIGIRIEDDVLITKTGIKVLSANLPSDLI